MKVKMKGGKRKEERMKERKKEIRDITNPHLLAIFCP